MQTMADNLNKGIWKYLLRDQSLMAFTVFQLASKCRLKSASQGVRKIGLTAESSCGAPDLRSFVSTSPPRVPSNCRLFVSSAPSGIDHNSVCRSASCRIRRIWSFGRVSCRRVCTRNSSHTSFCPTPETLHRHTASSNGNRDGHKADGNAVHSKQVLSSRNACVP